MNDLVIQAGGQSPGKVQRIGSREHDITRQNHAHHVAELVGDLLVADVQNVERDRQRPERMRRQDEAERVADAGDGLRVMYRQLFLMLPANGGRIPPDAFAAGFGGDHCLPHSDRLRAGRKK